MVGECLLCNKANILWAEKGQLLVKGCLSEILHESFSSPKPMSQCVDGIIIPHKFCPTQTDKGSVPLAKGERHTITNSPIITFCDIFHTL